MFNNDILRILIYLVLFTDHILKDWNVKKKKKKRETRWKSNNNEEEITTIQVASLTLG